MFSLILSICFVSGGIEICEHQTKLQSIDREECLYQMDMLMHDVKHSPFVGFDWIVCCSKENA